MTARERLIQSYVRLIKNEKITIDDVPEEFREEVRERMSEK